MSETYIVLLILSLVVILVNCRCIYLIYLANKSKNNWKYAKEGILMFVISIFLDSFLLSILLSK